MLNGAEQELIPAIKQLGLEETTIVNCTGLGSYDLFGDHELTPLKGQLTVLVPQQDVNYATFGGLPGAGGFIHMQPRSDGIALGGTSEEGDWSLEPDEEARGRIVAEHMRLFDAMRGYRSRDGLRRVTQAVGQESE